MTEQEFFDKLAECGEFEVINNEIRQKETGLCPICAVAAKLECIIPNEDRAKNQTYNWRYPTFANYLNLDKAFSMRIACAADNILGVNDLSWNREIRKKLLQLVK